MSSAGFPLRNGVFVAVVGPSGAGKDTLIAYARDRLAERRRVEFVRRVITRPSDRSSEDHDTLADAAFDEAESAGSFALSWSAHGLQIRTSRQPRRDHRIGTRRGRQRLARRDRAAQGALCQCHRRRDHRLGADPCRTAGGARPRIARRGDGQAGAQRRARRFGARRHRASTTAARARKPANGSSRVLRKAIADSPTSRGRCSAVLDHDSDEVRSCSEIMSSAHPILSTWLSQK